MITFITISLIVASILSTYILIYCKRRDTIRQRSTYVMDSDGSSSLFHMFRFSLGAFCATFFLLGAISLFYHNHILIGIFMSLIFCIFILFFTFVSIKKH